MSSFATLEKEVIKNLKKNQKKQTVKDKVFLQDRIYNTKLKFMGGLTVPDQRKTHKGGFSFSDEPIAKQAKIWSEIWKKSEIFEVKGQAIFFFEELKKKKTLDLSHWKLLKGWVPQIENWAHSDGISGIYSTLLEGHRKEVFPEIKKWNRSSEPWAVRQSLVSLIYYHNLREKVLPFSQIISLIKVHLDHPHYYVQKRGGLDVKRVYLFLS